MDGERSIDLQNRPDIMPALLPRYAAAIALGLLVVVALMVVARRFAGALAFPLEPSALSITGISISAVAVAIRLGWRFPSPVNLSTPIDRAVTIVTSLAVVTMGAGLCLPGTDVLGMAIFCALLGSEESWAWGWHLRRCSPSSPSVPSAAAHPRPCIPALDLSSPAPHVEAPPEEVTQQLIRSHAADGADELSGWLRTTFLEGQRTGNIHVAFCPPFAATPELEAEQIDGPETRIRTAQLLPYGVRFDLKLATTAEEPTYVVIQFSARIKSTDG